MTQMSVSAIVSYQYCLISTEDAGLKPLMSTSIIYITYFHTITNQ